MAVTRALLDALMAGMCAVATQPKPIIPTLYCFTGWAQYQRSIINTQIQIG